MTVTDGTIYQPGPWLMMPPGFDSFDWGSGIPTPAIGAGNVTVLQFSVPSQYRGIIRGLTHYTTGPGFQQGSGDLIWRIRLDNKYVRNYGNISVEFGDKRESRETFGILLNPGQTVYYLVQNVNYAPAGTRIVCQMKGWYWPL